jgi:DNA mismatch repair ATPase MutS
LPLTDHIRTHFEGGENLADFSGALDDDLHRARAMLDGAGPKSLLIVNEIFMSTSPDDALLLSRRILHQVLDLRSRAVFVTFLDELATFDPCVVSMVAQIELGTSNRTFRVRRQPPDGRAYAEAMARSHGLDTDSLLRRLS